MGDSCERTNCWCDLEWFCRHAGLARVFGGDQTFGDPYCYSLPFVVRTRYWFPKLKAWWNKRPIERGFVEFVGVVKLMRSCQYRAMRTAVKNDGWRILSTRSKGGTMRTIEVCKGRKSGEA